MVKLKAYKNDDKMIFEVLDNGKGIEPDLKNTLFEWFETTNKVSKDSYRGMGLGLPICKAIIEAHGGSIIAKNVKPHGALFKVSLPL